MSQGTEELEALVEAKSTHNLEVRVVDELTTVPGQQETWNALVDTSAYPNVFLRWEWITSWWKWFGKRRQLYVIVVLDGSTIVGIVPLYLATARCGYAFRGRKLAFIGAGGPTCPEYLGPIVHRDYVEPVIQEVTRYLQSSRMKWNILEFHDVAPDDYGTKALIDQLSNSCPALSWPGEVCPYLDLPESYEALLERMSSHGRQRERRQLRRAKKECTAQLDVVDTPDAAARVFPTMARLSSSSRRRAGQDSPFLNKVYARFHQEVITELISQGIARIHILNFDGRPVGFIYGFLYHGKYCSFQTGFDCSVQQFSPGDVLHQMVLQDLISQGVTEFDFLRGEESYKKVFANDERRTQSTYVFPSRRLFYVNQWVRTRVYSKLRNWVTKRLAPVRNDGRK